MATYKLYKLHFTAPLHIGSPREDDDVSLRTIHSDTLYAALMACLAKVGTDLPADGDLGFTLSDAFPYYQKEADSEPVYFLPKPQRVKMPHLDDLSKLKAMKKVAWIDAALYADVLAGADPFAEANAQAAYLTKAELPKDIEGNAKDFVCSEVSQRVTIKSRTGEEDAEPYFVDKIVFKDHAGLYFLAEGNTVLLERALKLLSLEGIGTDRGVGFGFFDYEQHDLNLNLLEEADHQVSLSLFIPESKAQLEALLLDSDDVAYDFVRRGGWITTPPYTTLRKNAIYAFLPGSVFKKTGSETALGRIVNLRPQIGNLTPDHPIWRMGRALMLPINIKH
ncbi:MAG: type III-A CRISPR-associated RAMP protein Csm4 [Alloprevotella sp.]|nr:type III-A CRISPR-associated RAMP protein Csm4 [Alloprevotella sp.]